MCALSVEAAPGTTRLAAATYTLVSNIAIHKILEAVYWSRASTMFNHYTRQLIPEALKRLAEELVDIQAGVMNQLSDPDPIRLL